MIAGGGISKIKNKKIRKTGSVNAYSTEENASANNKKKSLRNERTNNVPVSHKDNLKTIDSTGYHLSEVRNPAIINSDVGLKQSKLCASSAPSTNTSNNAVTIKAESANSKISKLNYIGFAPNSVKTIWEQHNQSDFKLSQEVCERVAEDVSYKVWELISQIKTYARHSAGRVTAALVNEVLRDHDVPPALGAADSDWDCIKSDGVFYFHLDKVLELRDEYHKTVTMEFPNGPDFQCSWPLELKCNDLLKKYITNLIYACANGDADAFDITLKEVSFSPIIGAAYRMLLAKLIQILAFKQHDDVSARIWRFLRACSSNQYSRDLVCREEYLHLSEILICQLLATNESIKLERPTDIATSEEYHQPTTFDNGEIKVEINDVDMDPIEQRMLSNSCLADERIYKLIPEEDDKYQEYSFFSPYFATPVSEPYVLELCDCLGQLASVSAYFQNECTLLIFKRLNRFFAERQLTSQKEYIFLRRAIRGCIALGEYAFREFIPYIFKLSADDVPEFLWNDFALSALYLKGSDDIFLYEWLSHVCGHDKLLPFMTYFAQYHKRLMICRKLKSKKPTYYINPKISIRRFKWQPLMSKNLNAYQNSMKSPATLQDFLPDITIPKLNKKSIIINVAGCQALETQLKRQAVAQDNLLPEHVMDGIDINMFNSPQHYAAVTSTPCDIIIARRRLLKTLTNEPHTFGGSEYHFLTI